MNSETEVCWKKLVVVMSGRVGIQISVYLICETIINPSNYVMPIEAHFI